GTGDRKSGNRQAAGQRLQQDETKGVGLAREYENIGRRIDFRQFLAVPRTEKNRIRKFPLQRRTGRTVADHELGAGQIEFQEGLEILFDRNSPDAEEYRRRQTQVDGAPMEQ